jgi:hypothetical protein
MFVHSLRENEAAFDRYKIRPRILINVDKVDTSTEIFGTKVNTHSRLLLEIERKRTSRLIRYLYRSRCLSDLVPPRPRNLPIQMVR